MTPEALAEICWDARRDVLPRSMPMLEIVPWSVLSEEGRARHVAIAATVLDGLFGADRDSPVPGEPWLSWPHVHRDLEQEVYDVVRFLMADENDGLTHDEVAPKIQDWADHSSGPPKAVYAAAARALAEPPPEDPTTLDRPEREWRRVPKRPAKADAQHRQDQKEINRKVDP